MFLDKLTLIIIKGITRTKGDKISDKEKGEKKKSPIYSDLRFALVIPQGFKPWTFRTGI